MITLKEALKLAKVRDDEVVYLHFKGDDDYRFIIMTAEEIKKKYDLQAVKVLTIAPHFTCGDFVGMEFEITGIEMMARKSAPVQINIGYGLYSVHDVANFVLKWFADNKAPITNLHLQGILYFLWIDYYKETGKTLYDDPFLAQKFGSIVMSVYDKYCSYGGYPIDQISDFYVNAEDEEILDGILNRLQSFSTKDLTDQLREYRKPWFIIFDYGRGRGKDIPFKKIVELECKEETK